MGARVLIVGQDPYTVDFSSPTIQPGWDAPRVMAGIAMACRKLEEMGYSVDHCMTDAGATAGAMLAQALEGKRFDCVVVGSGIRVPPHNLGLLEIVINAIHRHAPGARIAFNTSPEDTGEAALRWIGR
jgi:hypothetical protein